MVLVNTKCHQCWTWQGGEVQSGTHNAMDFGVMDCWDEESCKERGRSVRGQGGDVIREILRIRGQGESTRREIRA